MTNSKPLILILALAVTNEARAQGEIDRAFSQGFLITTFSPILLPISYIQATSENAKDAPNKAAFIRNAAVDAAGYLNGQSTGPSLKAFFDLNSDISEDEIVDAILEAAENL